MRNRTTRSGHTLESAYWTGDVYEVEDEIERMGRRENAWEFNNKEFESVADFVDGLKGVDFE
jgi:hypothetical protein|tara:strand:- start:191 stop:376 length:186 start_codon:yes stop_codon:yes gene_type:complete